MNVLSALAELAEVGLSQADLDKAVAESVEATRTRDQRSHDLGDSTQTC
jgi:hypothetical protein